MPVEIFTPPAPGTVFPPESIKPPNNKTLEDIIQDRVDKGIEESKEG